MKNLIFAVVALPFLFVSPAVQAQEKIAHIISRVGVEAKAGATYTYNAVWIEDGKKVDVDAGYLTYPGISTGEAYIGAGYTLIAKENFFFVFEGLVDFETGNKTAHGVYFQPWIAFGGKCKKLNYGGVIFPYLPLNKAGAKQLVIENITLSTKIPGGNLEGGYAAYASDAAGYHNKPFIGFTPNWKPLNNITIWYQRDTKTHGNIIQIRFHLKKKI